MATSVILCLALVLVPSHVLAASTSSSFTFPDKDQPAASSSAAQVASSSAAAAAHPATTWTPVIACSKTPSGETIEVAYHAGLAEFSLLVVNPPQGCTADLGAFTKAITIPENCFTASSVEIALQYTASKDIIGGRHYRHFKFSCLDLGVNGQVKELSVASNPTKTEATDKSANYKDGTFSLLVTTKASLDGAAPLTPASSISWSQDGVYLVLQHSLAVGSAHRTLIPTACKVSSTSHPDTVTFYLGETGKSCETKPEILGPWSIKSRRLANEDVTSAQMFPFTFKSGEQVMITCGIRECPYVTTVWAFGGTCRSAYDKFAECGGSFIANDRFRRALLGKLLGGQSEVATGGTTRVISATFTVA